MDEVEVGQVGFDQIVRELPDLLDMQVQAIMGRSFNDLTTDERAAYENRRQRILELRSALKKLNGTR